MKTWFWLFGAAALLFAWLALRGPSDEAALPPAVVKTVMPPARTAPPPAVAAAAADPQPHGIRVHGVLFRGERDPGSQALLSVEGAGAQPFRVGDAVAQGWSLDSVAPDHVVLALGPARARLEVTYSVRAPDTAVPAQPIPVAAKPDLPPGLTPAVEGAAPPGPPAVTGNKRFLEDRMKRQGQAQR
jgi:hypothetical protein